MTDTPDHPTPDTPTIRTHATTTVQGLGMFARVPSDWPVGIPVLVVAGLPEGATIRRLCDLDETREKQGANGEWFPPDRNDLDNPGLVVCRPVPVPTPPATERVPWHDAVGRRQEANGELIHQVGRDINGSAWYRLTTEDGVKTFASWNADADGMVEVLVEAPTGGDEPQADTPTPQGAWVLVEHVPYWRDSQGVEWKLWDVESSTEYYAAQAALADLVRRDGTDPTADLPSVAQVTNQIAETLRHPEFPSRSVEVVLAAVRALRDGGAR